MPSDNKIGWFPYHEPMSADAFIQKLTVMTARQEPVTLHIERTFMDCFAKLNDETAQRIVNLILKCPVNYVIIAQDLLDNRHRGTRSGSLAWSRFHQLCKMLKDIPTITSARVPLYYAGAYKFDHVLQYMPNATELSVYVFGAYAYRPNDEAGNEACAEPFRAAIMEHGSLQNVDLYTPSHFHRDLLFDLAKSSTLQSVGLYGDNGRHQPRRTSQVQQLDAAAIAYLLQQKPSLKLELQHHDFSNDSVSESLLFNAGIEKAESLQSLTMMDCVFGPDTNRVINILQKLPVQTLALERLNFMDGGDMGSFMIKIADGLESMTQLTAFRFALLEDHNTACVKYCQEYLLQKVCQLQSLRVLSLGLLDYTDETDRRLAKYVESSEAIRELYVCCLAKTDSAPVISAFALRRAVGASYMLEEVSFTTRMYSGRYRDPWDPELRRFTAIVTRLNRSGRSYMLSDPNNKARGVKVLRKVKDDADCLYHHLRENPLLCLQQPVGHQDSSGQRKRRHGMSLRSSSRASKVCRRDF